MEQAVQYRPCRIIVPAMAGKPATSPDWIRPKPEGLTIAASDGCQALVVDAMRKSPLVAVTHGHADHARPGNGHVIATPQTLDIMAARYGAGFAQEVTPLEYHRPLQLGMTTLTLKPAGHVLGSAQILLERGGQRVVISGDYKRKPDPTCDAFVPVPCDIFITEATFALPVFRHPDPAAEIDRLLASLALFPERCHVIGAYSLGKAQRLIRLIRDTGYDAPIFLHGALVKLCQLYERWGVELGPLLPATAGEKGKPRAELAGKLVLAPPSAIADRWARRLPDALVVMASGWMQVRQRAKQAGVELPLVLSDHADWDDLLRTIREVNPREVWVTHGREDALIHACAQIGIRGRALKMIGYGEEGE